jgi:hypothetical protein
MSVLTFTADEIASILGQYIYEQGIDVKTNANDECMVHIIRDENDIRFEIEVIP